MSAPIKSHERVVGCYKLGKQLGEGGQGQVFRGTSLSGESDVAVKLYLLPHDERLQGQLRRRVEREVKALQMVSSTSVVRVVESGEVYEQTIASAGSIWVAFEFAEGRHLRYMMSRAAPDTQRVMEMLSVLAAGLDCVHRAKIVHRDIKPENVILRNRKWADPVLVDFGYARQVSASQLTRTGIMVGTDAYIAPEVRRDPRAASPAADQWSFARLSAELLLWAARDDDEQLPGSARVRDEVVERCEGWPSLQYVYEQALDDDPTNRFEDVTAFAVAMEEALYADGVLEHEEDEPEHPGLPWDKRRSLTSYLVGLGLTVVDRRPDGALWVITGQEEFEALSRYLLSRGVQFGFAPNGGRASGRMPAWYTKSNR